MTRLARGCFVFGTVIFTFAVAGCGDKKASKPPGGGVAQNALRVVSAPAHYTQVGDELKYQAVLSQPGAAQWVLAEKPEGATIDEGGNIAWKASNAQGGSNTFTVQAQLGSEKVEQTFKVTAAQAVVQASTQVDPKDANGATLVVEAPLSPVRGAALQIEPGALPSGPGMAVTISSMNHAPESAASKAAGVSPNDLKPVDFGPTGLAFKKPVKIHLPVSDAVLQKGTPVIQTYDYGSGKWETIKVLSVDTVNKLVVGEINHFSTYVVTPPSRTFELKLSLGAAGTACGAALMVRAPLAAGFERMPASFVNGYTGNGASAADVLAGTKAGDAFQIFTRVSARGAKATGEESSWALFSATRLASGKFKVNVSSERRGSPFLSTPPELAADDPEFLAWMNGSRVDFVFGGLGALETGASASAEASLYLVRGADADRPPPKSANALGSDTVTEPSLQPAAGVDANCDGAQDKWDLDPQAAPPPFLTGMPAGPVHAAINAPALFKVSSPQSGVIFSWKSSHSSVAVTSAMGGTVGSAVGSLPGQFQIDVIATLGTVQSRLRWELIVEPASVQAANTAPHLAVGASANIVRAGEPVTLTAYGKDAEQSSLTYLWATNEALALSATTGGTVVFQASEPGDYAVTCVANDGSATSAPATVTISVLSAKANRPPGVPSVAPISAVLERAPGRLVSLPLHARAVDPDGDELTYDFVPDRFTPPTFTLIKNGADAMFSSVLDGVYLFYVTATDSHGAVSPWTPVKIHVMPPLAAMPVDNDKDGYPTGADCNDGDPTVYPGAKEVCGDTVDQNCDQRDLTAAECDRDGDRFTTNQGDCDDNNAAIGPGAFERCDGIDNNCNGKTDEGFGLGVDCSGGEGACRVAAKMVCNATFTGVVCGGTPGAGQPEVCDGVDNDCNGQIDDLVGADGGDLANCGGCNVACQAAANSVAACVKGGCSWTCNPGALDLDRDPRNGCECAVSNGGVEKCDGLDNDCNGSVDEGAGAVFYAGDPATLGVGVCSSGSQVCERGVLVTVRAQQTPKPEVCDGLDNDCNGRVDDSIDLSTDPRNCGGCGLVCGPGQACQAGRCAGQPSGVGGADGGAGGFGGGFDGGAGGFGGFGGSGGFGGGPIGGGIALCSDATGSRCVDLWYDASNCGTCGNRCATGPCKMGVCEPGGGAGGTTGADGGVTPTCDANQPNVCPYAAGGGLYCTNFMTDPTNCGGCARPCGGGAFCQNGICTTATTTCGAPFTICGASCTSLPDDPVNCGTCSLRCGGVCEAATCQPAGTGAFGAPCKRNGECSTGALCMDEGRFGWPGGYCSMLCDASRPCASGQVCLISRATTAGGIGSCRQGCTLDTDCGGGRSGFKCHGGACAPDCLTAPASCRSGEMCDASGHCVPSTTTCLPPLGVCGTATGGMFCADLSKDAANCGTCGRSCGPGMVCNAGICQTGTGGQPGVAACPGTGGAPVCTNVYYDPANCGTCGTICPAGTTCQGGICQGPPTAPVCIQPMTLCGDGSATQPYFCSDFAHDPANCGRCGNWCGAGMFCDNGTCAVGQQTLNCPVPFKACNDPTGKPYCTDVAFDRINCGGCGSVCPDGKVCMNAACVQGPTGPDGGAPVTCNQPQIGCPDPANPTVYRCTDPFYDSFNCGTCGHVCPIGTTCQAKLCTSGGGDGGEGQPADAAPAGSGPDGGAT